MKFIDYTRDSLFSEQALKMIKEYYMLPSENSPQDAFARAAVAYSYGDEEFAQRIYDYASKHWFMFASPVLSNAQVEEGKWKSLPISCFLNYVPDTLEGLIDHTSETRWLSVKGGGVGGHWRDVRSVSKVSPGPIPFIKTMDADMSAYRQGKTRKGSYAAYLDVSHPDIEEFLSIRIPTGGDPNRKCFELHNAVNVTDRFMMASRQDLDWDLIDPYTKKVVSTVRARDLWERILETRFRTGEPYINFIDEANRHLPESQKKMGLEIHGSNLCFRGDTLVVITEGDITHSTPIKDLVGREFMVWSARKTPDNEWIPEIKRATAQKTGVQKLVEVALSNGSNISCTEDHLLALYEGDYIKAKDSQGCRLQTFEKYNLIVVSVNYTDVIDEVYDLHVEDNHNFYIDAQDWVLVHNCNEIHLATNNERTAVCCLSSLNLEKFDEWKDTEIVEDLIRLLDNVLQRFIDSCPDCLSKAKFSAMRERSLGLGAMGFHYLLQRKGIPFESALASSLNRKIFKLIQERAEKESRRLARVLGEPEDMKGTGLRNAHLTAIAPNANSAIIVSTSPSIEPIKSNAFSYRTRAGTHLVKNKYLEIVLEQMGRNDSEVWQSIILNMGSVQHLDFLSRDQKDVFKTAFELDQRWIIDHAGSRQPYISQGQSVNLFFPAGTPRSVVNQVHIMAWERKLKGLYYLRSSAEKSAEKVSMAAGESTSSLSSSSSECMSCHG